MVKKRRTLEASESQVTQFRTKALQYREAMKLSYDSMLWDAAVSNAVHAVMLMANAVTGREAGQYYLLVQPLSMLSNSDEVNSA